MFGTVLNIRATNTSKNKGSPYPQEAYILMGKTTHKRAEKQRGREGGMWGMEAKSGNIQKPKWEVNEAWPA